MNKFPHQISRKRILVPLISITTLMAVWSQCFGFEMEYSGPGSEFESARETYRDRDNEKANDRVNENDRNGKESSDKDREKANDYQRDHCV